MDDFVEPILRMRSRRVNATLHGRSVFRSEDVQGHNVFEGYVEWKTNGHKGIGDAIDLFAPGGTKVYAIGDGVQDKWRNDTTKLEYVRIRGDNWLAIYAHINAALESNHVPVRKGQLLGRVRSDLSDPHLHFELWFEGVAVSGRTPGILRQRMLERLGLLPAANGDIRGLPRAEFVARMELVTGEEELTAKSFSAKSLRRASEGAAPLLASPEGPDVPRLLIGRRVSRSVSLDGWHYNDLPSRWDEHEERFEVDALALAQWLERDGSGLEALAEDAPFVRVETAMARLDVAAEFDTRLLHAASSPVMLVRAQRLAVSLRAAMDELAPQMRTLIYDAVRDLPRVVLSGNWNGLDDELKVRVYKAIVEALLGRDQPTVAAVILNALEDDRVTTAEIREAVLTWAKARAGDDQTLQTLLNGLDDGSLSRSEVLATVSGWAQKRVNDETLLGVIKALEDGSLSGAEVRAVLVAAAGRLGVDSGIAGAFYTALEDGNLTGAESLDVIVAWARRQVKNPAAQALLDAFDSGNFDAVRAKAAFFEYLDTSGLKKDLADAIKAALDSDGSRTQKLLLLLAGWAGAAGERSLAELLKRPELSAEPEKAVIAWLSGRLPEEIAAVFEKIRQNDWLGLATLILGTLDLGLSAELLKNLAAGEIRQAVQTELERLLSKAGVFQAGDVAKAVIELATGARSLFAEGAESDAPELSEQDVALWREIRGVIYIAQLFLNGGKIVSISATGDLHVFQAAKIRYTSPLNELLPKNPTKKERESFCSLLTKTLDAHFRGRFPRLYDEDGAQVLYEHRIVPSSNGTIGKCNVIFWDVYDRIHGV